MGQGSVSWGKAVLHGAGQCFRGQAVLQEKTELPFAQPFTPRFGVFSWDYCPSRPVYPTFWRVFVGLLSFPFRLPHVLACFRGIIGPSGPFTPRFDVFSWGKWS